METKTYTTAELNDFQQELERYRVYKTIGGDKLSYIDFDQYLIDQRVCVRRAGDYAPAICDVRRFEELNEKFDQLRTRDNKRAYAKAKQLEALAATSAAG